MAEVDDEAVRRVHALNHAVDGGVPCPPRVLVRGYRAPVRLDKTCFISTKAWTRFSRSDAERNLAATYGHPSSAPPIERF